MVENDSLYAVIPEQSGDSGSLTHTGIDGFDSVDTVVRSSEHATKLEKTEIVELLQTEFSGGVA
jgi:hypothetical protein